MIARDAVETVHSASMRVGALCLIGIDDLREPCFQELFLQTLEQVADDLKEAYAVLDVCVSDGSADYR